MKLDRLVGNSKRCGFIEDVDGDGSGDFLFLEGIDKVVEVTASMVKIPLGMVLSAAPMLRKPVLESMRKVVIGF